MTTATDTNTKGLEPRKRAFLVSIFGEERTKQLEERAEAATKDLESAGIRHKAGPMGLYGGATSFAEVEEHEELSGLASQLIELIGNILSDPELSAEDRITAIVQAADDFAGRASGTPASAERARAASPVAPYIALLTKEAPVVVELEEGERRPPKRQPGDTTNSSPVSRYIEGLFTRTDGAKASATKAAPPTRGDRLLTGLTEIFRGFPSTAAAAGAKAKEPSQMEAMLASPVSADRHLALAFQRYGRLVR
ncbi:MAG TPA: hypothetical protein VI789_01145 [Dehalococcoidia bacterium]|nr:hypothetical protein [Dehalococcoidia bacterium]